MRTITSLLAVVAVGAALPGVAAVETVTSAPVTFKLYIDGDATYALSSAEDFATWHVTWRNGETVAAESADGTAYTLSGGADAASAALPNKGGVWTLVNSVEGVARVGVPWTVFDDGGDFLKTSGAAVWFVDTMQDGPNRQLKKTEVPPVAYSGDDWAGDLLKAATVTFTPPNDSGLEPAQWNKANPGTGAAAFTFNAVGEWTIMLTFADGTMRTAIITIENIGFTLVVR